MNEITFDKSRAARFHARVNEKSVAKMLVFTNADGTPYDITALDFEFILQYRPNTNKTLFVLTVGDGLTIQDTNKLIIEVSEERATVTADTYFYRLFSDVEGMTWLNGPFSFHNGEFDLSSTDAEIVINPNGDEITIEIAVAGGTDNNIDGGTIV